MTATYAMFCAKKYTVCYMYVLYITSRGRTRLFCKEWHGGAQGGAQKIKKTLDLKI